MLSSLSAFLLATSSAHGALPLPATVAIQSAPPAVIQTSPLPSLQDALQPLVLLIAEGESRSLGGYDAANSGRGGDLGYAGLSRLFGGRTASSITVGEIMAAQDRGSLHAAGRYQIIGSTMRLAVRWADVAPTEPFSPEVQDRLFLALLQHKRPEVWEYLRGEGCQDRAVQGLAREWSSLPGLGGVSLYGEGGAISVAQVRRALDQARLAVAGA